MILCSPSTVVYVCFPLETVEQPIGDLPHLPYALKNKFGAWSWAYLLFVAGVGSLALLNLVPPDYENKMFQIGLVLALKSLFTSEMGDKTKGFYDFKIKWMALKGFRMISSKTILVSMAQWWTNYWEQTVIFLIPLKLSRLQKHFHFLSS